MPLDLKCVKRVKRKDDCKRFKIKKFYFWLIKPKMALCGVSGGILRELDRK